MVLQHEPEMGSYIQVRIGTSPARRRCTTWDGNIETQCSLYGAGWAIDREKATSTTPSCEYDSMSFKGHCRSGQRGTATDGRDISNLVLAEPTGQVPQVFQALVVCESWSLHTTTVRDVLLYCARR